MNGTSGCGVARAWMRSLAAMVAASADDRQGRGVVVGKNSTVLPTCSARVLVTYCTPCSIGMFRGWGDMPAELLVFVPGLSLVQLFVDDSLGVWWCKRCAVEIKVAIDLDKGRKLWIDLEDT